jgi:hypothetical protein
VGARTMSFWVDTPYVTAYVRNEFLYDQQKGHGEFTEVTVFGFRAEPMRVPMFQIMTAQGAQWARIPIHALCSKPCPAISLQIACWWDSFSRFCEVREVQFLRNHRVQAMASNVRACTSFRCSGPTAVGQKSATKARIITLSF